MYITYYIQIHSYFCQLQCILTPTQEEKRGLYVQFITNTVTNNISSKLVGLSKVYIAQLHGAGTQAGSTVPHIDLQCKLLLPPVTTSTKANAELNISDISDVDDDDDNVTDITVYQDNVILILFKIYSYESSAYKQFLKVICLCMYTT